MSRSPRRQLSQNAREQTSPASVRGSTSSQLRNDIDSGRTGDKVEWPDPAAAPLGTDAEAAGAPPTAHAVMTARQSETVRSSDPVSGGWQPGAAWVLAFLVLMIMGVLIGWIVVKAV